MVNFWTDKKVAVTGGSGLIGTPMIEALKVLGAKVENFDLPNYDVTDLDSIGPALEDAEICIHLAAMSHVERSRNNSEDCLDVNIRGTYTVLEACLNADVRSIVIASSNHVYGKQETFPVPETAQLNQLDTYSVSKICADYLGRAYAHNYELPVAVIRNTNCYGPRDPHHDHIIPGTILSILKGDSPILRSMGDIRKGYLYIDDVVAAYLLIAELMYEGRLEKGEVFNVGAMPVSSLYLVETIQNLMGNEHVIGVLGQTNDQHNEAMDSSKIERLGWRPKHTLEEGLLKTITWFRENVPAVVPV